MANLVLISKDNEYAGIFDGFNLKIQENFYDDILEENPDIIILDKNVENSKIILLNILSKNTNKNFEIFYITDENSLEDIPRGVKIFLTPLNKTVIENEINLVMENKAKINGLYLENMELKKNLYQIDAFYNASSKFAGTLDKEKLYEVLFETLERVLSFDISCALIKDNFEEDKLKFYIRSLKKVTDNLNQNLIKRLALSAKDEGLNELRTNNKEIEIISNIKPSHKIEFLDSMPNEYDKLSAPILISDKFEGVIEVFRKNPFSKEDITCFQSIVHQVLAPLRSAIYTEEIINANSKLKKLERIKSEFVSIVSHELRTPITPINNALSIILSEKGGEIGETNKNFAMTAKRNVARLSGIIEDLLDLSRIQTGKFDFKFKKDSIYPSFELAYSTFKNQTQAKNINFEVIKPDNLPDIYIDSHRIDQIISNLITNAIKFTDEKGKIELKAEVIQNPDREILISPILKEYKGEYLKISVSDTGVGIEEEDFPKIFDKFSQIENTLSRNTGGIGLGLTITKHFVDAHLGGIWVNSKKNEGSTFNVIIPVYSENTAFEADLNLKIKTESNVAYFLIKEPINSDIYSKLKENNIIKLTKNSKELSFCENSYHITKVFISGIEKSAYEFMAGKIEEEIKLINAEKNCSIVLSKAYYKKDIT